MTTPHSNGPRVRESSSRTGRIIALCMAIFAICIIFTSISCGTKSDPADHPLTEDERYLIDTYIAIVRARDLHIHNPSEAESLFAAIDTTTDTLRIANTITRINETPERWQTIFKVIDARLQKISKKTPETQD